MSRVLRRPVVAHAARRVDAPGPTTLPPELRALLSREIAAAREAGRAEGIREGRELARGELEAIAVSLRASLADGLAELRAWREEHAARTADLALAVARHIIGEGVRPALGTVERLREALAAIDDAPLEVLVHPGDVAVVGEALAGEPVTVRPEPSLRPGEARVRGPWASVDLTYEAAWEVVRAYLVRGTDGP